MLSSKTSLRQAALARRKALSLAEVARRSEQLSKQLFQHFPVASWHWLHVFLPLLRRHEPDTWPIIHHAWAQGLRVAVPLVQVDGTSLQHYELNPSMPLIENRWGIPEPDATAATSVNPQLLDAVLVPLLVADQAGQRVGYGGGFYDRFLASCRPHTRFIGLNVLDEAPIERIADVLPTDVPLHAYITPSGIWRF